MTYLVRGLSALFGMFLIVSSGFLALLAAGFPQGEPFIPPVEIFASVFGFGMLLASGFMQAALFGQSMPVSRKHRATASALLAVPVLVGALLLLSGHPEVVMPASILAGAACVVLACVVWRRAPGPAA